MKNLCQNICKPWQVCWKIVPERIMVGCKKVEDGRELGKNEKEFHVFAVVKHEISPVFFFIWLSDVMHMHAEFIHVHGLAGCLLW